MRDRIERREVPAKGPEARVTARGDVRDHLLRMQATAGNRAVGAVLARGRKGQGQTASPPKKKSKPVPAHIAQAQHNVANRKSYAFGDLPADAQTAITDILAGNDKPYLRPNQGRHGTDPETWLAKGQGIGVREYHVDPSRRERIVVRTAGKDKRVYWDPSHAANTYTYNAVTGVPFPVAAPAPAPAPVPAPAPLSAPVPAPAAVVASPVIPELDDWEKWAD